MIASVDGVVAVIGLDSLVLEVGGIGYRVFAAPRVIASARPGGRLKLFTHHLVAEDRQALFGFATPEELGFFDLLLTVTGVGPKVALAIVGSRAVPDLQLAILQQDQALLVAIPGIGKKLAERVIFELKEKVAAAGTAALAGGRRTGRRRDRGRRRAPGPGLQRRRGARGLAGRPRRPGHRRNPGGPREGCPANVAA